MLRRTDESALKVKRMVSPPFSIYRVSASRIGPEQAPDAGASPDGG